MFTIGALRLKGRKSGMKEIFWSEVGGAAVTGAVVATIKSGKVLPTVKDLDLITAGGIVVLDALVSDHLGPVGSAMGNGAAAYSIGYITQRLTNKYLFKPVAQGSTPTLVTTSSGSTSVASGSSTVSSSAMSTTGGATTMNYGSGTVASLTSN